MIKSKIKFNFVLYLMVIFITIGFSLSLRSTTADDWYSPASNPPGDDVTVINTSDTNQEKKGSLILNTAGNPWGLLVGQGNVGIGVTVPVAKLDVDGGVKIGNDSAVCNSNKEGTIRYDSVNDNIDFCDGSDWKSVDLECIPDCAGKECGPDGCGGSCPDLCGSNAACSFSLGICSCDIGWDDCDSDGNCECDLSNHECSGNSCICISHDHQSCYSGNVCWYDSCGNREEVYDYCTGSNEVCFSGNCVCDSGWDDCNSDGNCECDLNSHECSGNSCVPLTCTSFTYSTWSACDPCTNTQTRTVTASYPAGCTGGSPITSQTVANACSATSYTYGGYAYPLVSICGKCWFAENLKISTVSNYCNPAGCNSPWGRLYSWNVATNNVSSATSNVQGICPSGWHIPRPSEVYDLIAGGSACLKSTSDSYWITPGNNDSGFNIPGAGIVSPTQGYMGRTRYAEMWTSLMNIGANNVQYGTYLYINYGSAIAEVNNNNHTNIGMSVRCVKD